MQDVYKTLNHIQTHLITWGNPFDCNGSDVIICITGNPGVPDFYIEFCAELHKNTGLPVCIVGQAGHEEVPDKASNILEKRENLFNLQGQLSHKFDLIANYIDKNSKLHLIGHSIGAWMIIELFQNHADFMNRKVSSINLLFPTIQRMAESSSGKLLNGIIRKFHFLAILLFTFIYLLPETIRVFLIGIYLKFNSLPLHYSNRILKYLNPLVGEKVLFLAYDEMDSVTNLNTDGLDQIKHLTNIIYSNRDGWVPVHYMDNLKTFQPPLQIIEVDADHAFVLKSSERIAEMVTLFIHTKLK